MDFPALFDYQKAEFESDFSELPELSAEDENLFINPPTPIKMDSILAAADPLLSSASVTSSTDNSVSLPLFEELDDPSPDFIVYSEDESDGFSGDHNYVNRFEAVKQEEEEEEEEEDDTSVAVAGESAEETAEESISSTNIVRKKTRRGRKRKVVDLSEQVTNYNSKKAKLYEQGPANDPTVEKCRQNAINAKRNRDRLKLERVGMKEEIKNLNEENKILKKKTSNIQNRAEVAEKRLSSLLNLLKANNLQHIIQSHSEFLSATDPEE